MASADLGPYYATVWAPRSSLLRHRASGVDRCGHALPGSMSGSGRSRSVSSGLTPPSCDEGSGEPEDEACGGTRTQQEDEAVHERRHSARQVIVQSRCDARDEGEACRDDGSGEHGPGDDVHRPGRSPPSHGRSVRRAGAVLDPTRTGGSHPSR